MHVVCRSQWKDGSTEGNAVISCDVTDSVVTEMLSKYEVRSLWRKRSIAWESSTADVAMLKENRGLGEEEERTRKGQAAEYQHKSRTLMINKREYRAGKLYKGISKG